MKLVAKLLTLLLLTGLPSPADATGICDFFLKKLKKGVVSGEIIRGPWSLEEFKNFKYKHGIEIGDTTEGPCGVYPNQSIMVFTNNSVKKCRLGGKITASGNGVEEPLWPAGTVYKMQPAKVSCD